MITQVWAKLCAMLKRNVTQDELREELDAHLQMEVEAHIERGLTPAQALTAAKRQLGNRTLLEEMSREAWTFCWFETLLQDLRYAARGLRRSAAFALTAVSMIALGIGATTAAFTLFDHVLLRRLPFPRPEQLVTVYQTAPSRGVSRLETSPPNFIDWRAMNKSFSSLGAYAGPGSITLSGYGEPTRIGVAVFNADVLRTLDIQPIAGRGFTPDDERSGAPDVALLEMNLAATLFGSASGAIGGTVTLDDRPRRVVGVMPPGFVFPTRDAVVWVPFRFTDVGMSRTNLMVETIGRLRPGVSAKEARADMAVIAGQLERAYPKDNAGVGATVVEMRDVMSPQSRMLVVAVFSAACCLLLIACTNLANLLLARAATRRQEMAVRVAIGAGRGRLIRQLLTESLVLAVAGGALGIGLATIASPWLARFVPSQLPVSSSPVVDVRVWGFAALVTASTCLLFGVGPALRSWHHADPQALRARSGGHTSDRVRAVLVLGEVAGTVTLLVGAGLLVKALWRVQAVVPGFRPDGVLTLQTALPMPKYREAARRQQFYARVLTDVHTLPNVSSAGYTTGLPLVFGAGVMSVTVSGRVENLASDPRASIRFVTPEFFATLRIPLRRGRYLTEQDNATSPFVTVIGESLAGRLWPGQDPIGRHLTVFGSERAAVGVVGDIVVRGLERVSEPQMYFSPEQLTPFSPFYAPKDLVVRASGDPLALVPALRRIIHDVDPGQPISNVKLLDEILASQTASRRDQLYVLGGFAAIALVLAAVGMHGLLSFAVSARTQEIGVRVALGAPRRTILGMFLRQGIVLGAAGVAVAVPISYAAARGMTALLFGVQPSDPIIYSSAVLLAMTMALAGTLRPAVRASIIDPAVTLRAE